MADLLDFLSDVDSGEDGSISLSLNDSDASSTGSSLDLDNLDLGDSDTGTDSDTDIAHILGGTTKEAPKTVPKATQPTSNASKPAPQQKVSPKSPQLSDSFGSGSSSSFGDMDSALLGMDSTDDEKDASATNKSAPLSKPTAQSGAVKQQQKQLTQANPLLSDSDDGSSDISIANLKGLDDSDDGQETRSDEDSDDGNVPTPKKPISPANKPVATNPAPIKVHQLQQNQKPAQNPPVKSPVKSPTEPSSGTTRSVGNLAKMFEARNMPLMKVATLSDMETIKKEAKERSESSPYQAYAQYSENQYQSSSRYEHSGEQEEETNDSAYTTSVSARASFFERQVATPGLSNALNQPSALRSFNPPQSTASKNTTSKSVSAVPKVASKHVAPPTKTPTKPKAESKPKTVPTQKTKTTKSNPKQNLPQKSLEKTQTKKSRDLTFGSEEYSNYGEKLYSRGLNLMERQQNLRETVKKEELEKCTFKPKISTYAQNKSFSEPFEVRATRFEEQKRTRMERV